MKFQMATEIDKPVRKPALPVYQKSHFEIFNCQIFVNCIFQYCIAIKIKKGALTSYKNTIFIYEF